MMEAVAEAEAEARPPRADDREKSDSRGLKRERPRAAGSRLEVEPGQECRLSYMVAGTKPERFVGRLAQKGFDHLVFVDAVDFGGMPGSVILLDSDHMTARFPQVSTHKVSLGLLAKWVEANGTTKAWLLGVQPESLKWGAALSPSVQSTLVLLQEVFANLSTEVAL